MTAGPLLFDAHHLGRRQTGNETWTRNMVRAMQNVARAGEIEYAVAAPGRDSLVALTQAPVHEVSTSSARRLTVDLPRVIRATRARAVLVTYTAPLSRCPAVIAVHDVSPFHHEAREWLPTATRLRHRITVGASVRRAAHVLVLSEATRRDVSERLGIRPERISVAPCAVDVDLLGLLGSVTRRHPDGDFRVLAVGTVVPRKNLLLLARAVRAAIQAGVPARLRLVGPVPKEGEAIAAEVTGLLGPAVEVVGYVDNAGLAAEYVSADVVCFPSLMEGFGLPVVEAMAAGVPVMVSDTSALREVSGEAALVCDAHDPGAWQHGLLRIQTDRGMRDELCRRGRARAADFSWEESARIALDALRAAAARAPRPPSPGS